MTGDNAFLTVLDKCRSIIKNNMKGKNTLSYLLLHLNNKQIKNQLNYQQCSILSHLYLSFSCIPFEEMPFVTSLVNHNPRIHDLFDCLNTTNREHEFLARLVKNNAENTLTAVFLRDIMSKRAIRTLFFCCRRIFRKLPVADPED